MMNLLTSPFAILTMNSIAAKGLAEFNPTRYHVSHSQEAPQAILLRSADLHQYILPPSVEVIARAGAGVNNIPVSAYTKLGIPVMNTPGANANAVKELVIAGLLMAARHLNHALEFTRNLDITLDDNALHHHIEAQKKHFSGHELPGKTLGIIGLGHIGVKVANAAVQLGMRVIGFDPAISIQNAWNLSSEVSKADSLNEIAQTADFISLHLPLIPDTQHLINHAFLQKTKKRLVLLNFARDKIVDYNAVKLALDQDRLNYYVCDFPRPELLNHHKVITLPHLGASTHEAEENCAVMAAQQIRRYLETGHLSNAVNFPAVSLPQSSGHRIGYRITVANQNVPNVLAQITHQLSKHGLNIIDMINKSRDEIAYTIFDVNACPSPSLMRGINEIPNVLRSRCIQPIAKRDPAHV